MKQKDYNVSNIHNEQHYWKIKVTRFGLIFLFVFLGSIACLVDYKFMNEDIHITRPRIQTSIVNITRPRIQNRRVNSTKMCPCSDLQLERIKKTRIPLHEEDYFTRQSLNHNFALNNMERDITDYVNHKHLCQCETSADKVLNRSWVDACIALNVFDSNNEKNTVENVELKSVGVVDVCDPIVVIDPGEAPKKAPKRVAHCLTGSTRALQNTKTVSYQYKRTVLLDLQVESDIFLVISDDDKLNDHERKERNEMYKNDFNAVESLSMTNKMWEAQEHWVMSSQHPRVHTEEAYLHKQFLKKELCYRMVRSREEKLGIRYTHFIETRLDLIFPQGFPSYTDIDNGRIWNNYYMENIVFDPIKSGNPYVLSMTPQFPDVLNPVVTGPEYMKQAGIKPVITSTYGEVASDIIIIIPSKFAHRYFRQMIQYTEPDTPVWGDRIQYRLFMDSGLAPIVDAHCFYLKLLRTGNENEDGHKNLRSTMDWHQ